VSSHTFTGGDKVMKAIEKIAKGMARGEVRVGFLEGSTYPDGTSTAAIAFQNEFGNPKNKQPPRPFFRQMIAEESPSWPGKIAKLAKSSNYDGQKVLAVMGEDIKGALQKSINTLTAPALAKSTIDRKGFDKPLIETSHMLNSVAYEVTE
jgi:hypothetical protein